MSTTAISRVAPADRTASLSLEARGSSRGPIVQPRALRRASRYFQPCGCITRKWLKRFGDLSM